MSVTQLFNGNVQFTVIDGRFDFQAAEEACSSLIPPGVLASFTEIEEFDFIIETIDLIQTIPAIPSFFWVGLRKENEAETLAANFNFIDGTPNPFVVDNEPPWADEEPNNRNGNQDCVAIGRGLGSTDANTLEDLQCAGDVGGPNAGAVCRQVIGEESNFIGFDEYAWYGGASAVVLLTTIFIYLFYREKQLLTVVKDKLKLCENRSSTMSDLL